MDTDQDMDQLTDHGMPQFMVDHSVVLTTEAGIDQLEEETHGEEIHGEETGVMKLQELSKPDPLKLK